MENVAINLTAGNLAGWSFITMVMPLDLIKTKLQLNTQLSIPLLKDLMKSNRGFFKTFYKGASSMYLFVGAAAAIEFSIFEASLLALKKCSLPQEMGLFAGGWTAGFASSLIYTPIQFAKIKTQISNESQRQGSARRLYDIIRQQKLAGLRQIYTGWSYTILREAFGLGIYYGGFHIFMRNVFQQKNREDALLGSQVGSAIFAGLIYNLWAYPFDTFKTNIQSGHCKDIRSMITAKCWQQKCFKQGMIVSLMRGLIADSTNLIMYENARNFVEKLVKRNFH